MVGIQLKTDIDPWPRCLLKALQTISYLYHGYSAKACPWWLKVKYTTPISIFPYIYIYAVEFKTGPRFGVSSVKIGPSPVLKTGPIFLLFSSIL